MTTQSRQRLDRDRAIIERYADQPAMIPPDLLRRATKLNDGRAPLLYAYADLDTDNRLTAAWVVLGHERLFLFSAEAGAEPQAVARAAISEVRELPGLSSNTLLLVGEDRTAPLLQVNYTRRQQRAMENIRFVLDQQVAGNAVEPRDPDRAYAEAMSSKIKDAQSSIVSGQFNVILRLLGYFRPYRRQVIVGFSAALVVTALSLVPPGLTGYLVDRVLRPAEQGTIDIERAMTIGFVIIGGLGLLHVCRELCVWIRLRRLAYLGENVAHDLRRDVYQHLQRLSLGFFSKKQTGSIISRVSSDTDRLWDFIAFGIVEATLSLFMLAGLGVVLVSMDWMLGLILVIPIPLFVFSFYLHGRDINRHFLRAWRKWSDLTAVLSDTIPGMRVVKAFSQEDRENVRFGDRNDRALESFQRVHRSWTRFWPVLMFSFQFVSLIVWALAVPRVLGAWGPPLSVGTFVAFLLYMGMFLHPLEVIGQVTRMLNRAVSSAHRVFEIMDTEPDASVGGQRAGVDGVRGDIAFENVSFSYDGVRDSLRNVDFEIRAGEMIGLVGPSGAGKSTVTNLVAGFNQATGGRVRIDGRDLSEIDTGSYRRHIGMVLQEPFLFHGTLLENIRYGQRDASLADVVSAARTANAHDFICKLPLGYDTVVGERGHTLSGGERQRVSIARAILHNPSILILDEATSNVDTETERKIQDALDRLISGRTVIAIAHRLSTLKRADRLLVMKDGKLVEEGTHVDLLEKKDGVYRRLHELQAELHEMIAV